jgi:PAS domain S-box-containing protein
MNASSLLGLIQNAALLLTIAILFDVASSGSPKNGFTGWVKKHGFLQLVFGFFLGSIGIALMLTPWVFNAGIIFDTRSVLLGISGLFFGTIPTVIAMLMTALFRLYQGGAATLTGVSVILASGMIGIVWRLLRRKPLEAITAWQLLRFGFLIHVVMLACMFMLPLETALRVLAKISLPVMTIYPLGTLLLGLLIVNRLKRERAVEDLQRNETHLRSLVEILQHRAETTQEFLDFALNEAVQLTESKIGYIYFYSEEREEFVLNTWSKGVMDECAVRDHQARTELGKAGIWGEAVRQRKPVILNNFQVDHPLKKGYPEGHVRLEKFLTVSIFSGEHIIAVVGVANKETDYDESDVLQLTLLMDGVWKMTERQQALDALRQSEERYEAMIKNLPNGIVQIFDRDFYCLFSAGEEMERLGLTNELLVGKTALDILGLDVAEKVANHYRRVLEGESVRFEWNYGDQTFLVNAAPLRDKNDVVMQILVLSINITERKQVESQREVALEKWQAAQAELQRLLAASDQSRQELLRVVEDQKKAEEEIRQLNARLEQRVHDRTDQLEAANTELEAFAYSVSHDLRAPLRTVDGFSAALMADYREKLDDQGQHYLSRILEGSRRMGQLIEDLLNLSRVTRRDMNREPVDLSLLANMIFVELNAQDSNRQVDFEIASNMMVQADPHLIKIALENLINNAYKFTGRRERARIQVGVTEQADERIYFVRDNGAGFDMLYAGKLFSPFQRLHTEQQFPGTGIGLVTVRRIITRHGGRVWSEAAVDQGATFYFTLGGA